jgi:dienelactone hydrolase
MINKWFPFIAIALVILIAACSGEIKPIEQNSDQAIVGTEKITPTATAESSQKPDPFLPADPQEISFQAADGQELKGFYYPSATKQSAPLVVLMHWAGGDMSDWYEIAPWLQNRGLKNTFTTPSGFGWWIPSWFPSMASDQSYGVFIFSFRNCSPFPEGCSKFDIDGWTLDAQAALQKAATLEGVDPNRISAIGSSIGADGVVDACAWINSQQPGACRGALSLSPGNYLGISYSDMVKQLGELTEPVSAWCFADEKEISFCNDAEQMGNSLFHKIKFPRGGHGNNLLSRVVEPSAMQGILDFLDLTIGK